jgi:gamma-glutamyltranspeptidase/glutathione hydrolase
VLGRTGIELSTRGEQFWLDRTRAQQIRPRSRPRYTLTPSIVLRGNVPLMAIGTPGGDNQDQTIVQTLLNILEFWPEWYPNVHEAIEWPKVQTLHFYDSFWPHRAGFNRLNVEAGVPDNIYNDLKARGHNVSRLKPFGMSGCATVVLRDPATGHFLAGADPRRECYALAF